MKSETHQAYRQKVEMLAAAFAVGGKSALEAMNKTDVHILLVEKSIDLRIANNRVREYPGDELSQMRLLQADAAVKVISGFIKEREIGVPQLSILDQIRQEIERDTKAAQSEPERLARHRAEKEQGPRETPKKDKDRGMER